MGGGSVDENSETRIDTIKIDTIKIDTIKIDTIKTEGDSLVIYPDKRKMIRRLNMRGLCILLPVVIGIFVLFAFLRRLILPAIPNPAHAVPPFIVTEFTLLPWCVLVFYFAIYVFTLAVLMRQNRPLITLSPEGLIIHTVGTQIGLLHWDEIGEVRTYTLLYRYVGIVPRDPGALYRRLGSRSRLLRLNSWCVPLYRLFGQFVAPINIPQEYLPMSADELAALIRERRPLQPPPPVAGVWPPAPQSTR